MALFVFIGGFWRHFLFVEKVFVTTYCLSRRCLEALFVCKGGCFWEHFLGVEEVFETLLFVKEVFESIF